MPNWLASSRTSCAERLRRPGWALARACRLGPSRPVGWNAASSSTGSRSCNGNPVRSRVASDADANRSRPSRLPPILAGVVGLPLLWVGGLVFSKGSLERRLTDNVQSRLDERFAGVVVDFDGRDAEVSGPLPAGASAHEVYEFVRQQPGVRHVHSRLESSSTDGELSAAVVELSIDRNGHMTLSGVVPSQLVKSQLAEAAARVAGDQSIQDRMAISAAVGPIPTQELDELANLVSSLP